MLTSIEAYLALRRAVGFRLTTEARLPHDFARWAAEREDTHVRTQTATEWAAAARSPWQRERRLRAVTGFARHVRAEDPRHEVPPIFVFGRRHVRPRPHIYSPDELRRLLDAASRLPAIWPLRPQVFTTLFGLLASSGLRVSEALALRFDDVTSDGLVIRKTKFNKSRLVPPARDRRLSARPLSRAPPARQHRERLCLRLPEGRPAAPADVAQAGCANRPDRSAWGQKDVIRGGGETLTLEVPEDRVADVLRKRQPRLAPSLAGHPEASLRPVEVAEPEPDDMARAQTQAGE
jgi:hypothetical protein